MKKQNIFFTLLILSTSLFAQPAVTSFAPLSGPVGTTVTVTGTNFNSTPVNNIVFFGATMASVTGGSTTSLSVTVPAGASYQNISVTDLTTSLTAFSARPFITTFACGETIVSESFAAKTDYASGSQPLNIATGDLDGDGKADIVVSNYSSNTVSVFRNISSGWTISFAGKADFATASGPQDLALSDMNGDGKLDIVTANDWTSNISVLKNTSTSGNISFAAKVDFLAGNSLTNIAIADLDLNGKPDIIVTNPGAGTNTSIFRNTSSTGTISFASKTDLVTGEWPANVSAGDFDGDGKPDLAVTSNFSNFVSVLRNTSSAGNITFATKVDYPTSNSPIGSSIGDLDGDGKPDLAVTNGNTPSVSVFRNTSSVGTISFAAKQDFTTGTYPTGFSIGNVDGDNKPDLVVANLSSNSVSVLKNNSSAGNLSFATKVDYSAGTSPLLASIADFNGDGQPDIAVVNQNSDNVSILRNRLCASVGTEDLTGSNDVIKIYPNPFNSQTTISFNKTVTGIISVFNLQGQVVFQSDIDNVTQKEIDLTGVPAGIYLVKVLTANGILSSRIVVE